MTSSSIHETRNKSSQNQEVGITTMYSCCPPYLSPLMYICAVYTPCKHKIIYSSWVHMINVDSTMCSISPKFTFYYQNVQCFVTLKKIFRRAFTLHTSESNLLLVCCISLCLVCRSVLCLELRGRPGSGHKATNIWTTELLIQLMLETTGIAKCPSKCSRYCWCLDDRSLLWMLPLVAWRDSRWGSGLWERRPHFGMDYHLAPLLLLANGTSPLPRVQQSTVLADPSAGHEAPSVFFSVPWWPT